jgi:hypothetical protein
MPDMMTETVPTSSENEMYDRPFQARRTGGTPKKFCCPAHRNAFHHLGAILESLTIDELAELPETVWVLLEFIAGPDFKEPLDPRAST